MIFVEIIFWSDNQIKNINRLRSKIYYAVLEEWIFEYVWGYLYKISGKIEHEKKKLLTSLDQGSAFGRPGPAR